MCWPGELVTLCFPFLPSRSSPESDTPRKGRWLQQVRGSLDCLASSWCKATAFLLSFLHLHHHLEAGSHRPNNILFCVCAPVWWWGAAVEGGGRDRA